MPMSLQQMTAYLSSHVRPPFSSATAAPSLATTYRNTATAVPNTATAAGDTAAPNSLALFSTSSSHGSSTPRGVSLSSPQPTSRDTASRFQSSSTPPSFNSQPSSHVDVDAYSDHAFLVPKVGRLPSGDGALEDAFAPPMRTQGAEYSRMSGHFMYSFQVTALGVSRGSASHIFKCLRRPSFRCPRPV